MYKEFLSFTSCWCGGPILLRAAGRPLRTLFYINIRSYNLKSGRKCKELFVCVKFTKRSPSIKLISTIASAFASGFQEKILKFWERTEERLGGLQMCNMRLYIIIASLETFLESHSLAVGRYGFCQLLSSLYFVSTSKISVYSARADRNEVLYTYVYMCVCHTYIHIYIWKSPCK